MISKLHKSGNELVLAVSDKNLIGKKLVSEHTEIIITKNFYGNKEISEKELLELVEKCTMGNFFGTKTIEVLKKNNLISESGIIYFEKVPHAQIIKMIS